MGAKRPLSGRRRKRCRACDRLFEPDGRTKGKQRYCSQQSCQKKRQRKNETDWRRRNPECLQYQYEQTRLWYKAHPEYSRERRAENPGLLEDNRCKSRERMQEIRRRRRFDKSKVILTQLTEAGADKCYLAKGYRWLHVRLTKASTLSGLGMVRENRANVKRVENRLPRGRLYDVSEEIFSASKSPP